MTYSPLLAPIVALVAWTLVIMAWMAATRFATFKKMGITLGNIPPGSRGANLEGKAPDEVQWKSHNYMHLMEQPTVFYAACVILSIGGPTGYDAILAWAYLLIRVVHSVYQARVNVVKIRAFLFVASTLVMVLLAFRALLSVLN